MVRATEDGVFKALGNPIRRRMLDLLRDGPRTTGELVRRFPRLSRFAVMQHLSVLEEAGLLLVRKEGRKRFNYLNAVPLRRLHERWVGRFADEAAARSLALERHLKKGKDEMGVRKLKIESEIRLDAPVERVWQALTTEQLEWYPHTYGQDRVQRLVFEERVGGLCYEDWGDGYGKLYGTITYFDPPHTYATVGYLRDGILLESWTNVEQDGATTVVKGTIVCFGDISDEQEEGIRFHGTLSKYEKELREYVETRAKVG